MAYEVRELKYILQITKDYVTRDKRLNPSDRKQMVIILDKYISSMNMMPALSRACMWAMFTVLTLLFVAWVPAAVQAACHNYLGV